MTYAWAADIGERARDHERARALVLQYGWNTTAYQILNPGFDLWFSAQHEAVVGYVEAGGRRVVGGAPVCAEAALADVAAEFERDSAHWKSGVVYFGAEERLERVYANARTHASLLLGAQPVWKPSDWPAIIASHASLRGQLNRARNKGVGVELWSSDAAERNPHLKRCLKEWLATRGLPPLHFLVEPETLGNLRDRRVFVAARRGRGGGGGDPVGFLIASPIAARDGWLTEQFVRGRAAPNGTAELMIDAAVRWMADENAQYVTFGLAPLSSRAGEGEAQSFWMRVAFGWVRAHGRRFYNFEGLDKFKAKFCPERWEAVYAISNERSFSMRSLYAIGSAFTSGNPFGTVFHGMLDAARQEIRWMKKQPTRRD